MESLEAKKARLKALRIARDEALPPPPPKPDPAAQRDAKLIKSLGRKLRTLAKHDPQLACEVMLIMAGVKSVDIIKQVPYKISTTGETPCSARFKKPSPPSKSTSICGSGM